MPPSFPTPRSSDRSAPFTHSPVGQALRETGTTGAAYGLSDLSSRAHGDACPLYIDIHCHRDARHHERNRYNCNQGRRDSIWRSSGEVKVIAIRKASFVALMAQLMSTAAWAQTAPAVVEAGSSVSDADNTSDRKSTRLNS